MCYNIINIFLEEFILPQKFSLGEGVEGLFIEDSRFNTTLVSFNFYMPLRDESYEDFALLPYVLSSCSDEYKTFRALNTELGNLYGATLSGGSVKVMDYQRISLSVSVLNDRFSLGGESVVSRAAELLASLIFAPSLQGEAFCERDVEREKQQMLDRIRGEINNKRGYARSKTLSLMFGSDPFGIPRFGREDRMQKVNGKSLFAAWSEMLRSAYIRINVIGAEMPEGIFSAAGKAFSAISRENITSFGGFNMPNLTEGGTVCERMDIAQGKLVMGFSLGRVGDEKSSADIAVMSDIFGGGPYSCLFVNVREKLSLCYYCACSAIRSKAIMMVDSGVEAANEPKARAEILNQLEIMKNGGFTAEQFDSSIRNICDTVKSVGDSQEAINTWYASRVFDSSISTPEEFIAAIEAVTPEQVKQAAQAVKLHTVYSLLPKEDKQ